MKLLVISDSHGWLSGLQDIAALCNRDRTIEGVIHLGDFEWDAQYLQERISQPIYSVRGNCDWGSTADAEMIRNIGGVNMLLTHGHSYHVKMHLLSLTYRAREAGVQVALFGHTHSPYMGYEQGILLLNPGALQNEKCAILTIKNGEAQGILTNISKLC